MVRVIYARRFYYCNKCKEEHEYNHPLFDLHKDYMQDYGRFEYDEVTWKNFVALNVNLNLKLKRN